ncbi:hypothetical protein PsYK624_072620 [Phanerochaete sordida]|uniref:Peptidase A2 domain-containing protein n=1 Tax=Phanerochaete sordida TaxID=48140 RepID=A0A9P3G854_9APHY|nr:hypothetical protein PsYK624_072620 [Phanerochaete sordida]
MLYLEGPPNGLLLSSRVEALLSMKLLGADIEQALVEIVVPQTRQKISKYVCKLTDPNLDNLIFVRREFDSILRTLAQATQLEPAYQIDANEVLLALLHGSDTLLEVRSAFIELQGRVRKAKRHLRRALATLLGVPENSPAPSELDLSEFVPAFRHPETALRKIVLHSKGVGRLSEAELRLLEEGTPLPAVLKSNAAYWNAVFGSTPASPDTEEAQVERHLLRDVSSPEAASPQEKSGEALHEGTAKGKAVAFQPASPQAARDTREFAAQVEDATPSDRAFESASGAVQRDSEAAQPGYGAPRPSSGRPRETAILGHAPQPQYPVGLVRPGTGRPPVPETAPAPTNRAKETPPHMQRNVPQRMSIKPQQFGNYVPGVVPATAPHAGRTAPQGAPHTTVRPPMTAPAGPTWNAPHYRQPLLSQAAAFTRAQASLGPAHGFGESISQAPRRGGPSQGGGNGSPAGIGPGDGHGGGRQGGPPPNGGRDPPPDDPNGGTNQAFPLFNPREVGRGMGGGGPSGPPGGGGYQIDFEDAAGRNNAGSFNLQPRIDLRLKLDDLPAWGGDFGTAIDYLVQVEGLAALGGHLPRQLGLALAMRFVPGSEVAKWFTTLPYWEKEAMRADYAEFLRRIRDNYLGPDWAFEQLQEYAEIKFRQSGEERETPCAFAHRRVICSRILNMVPTDDQGRIDGAAEVKEALRVFPIPWKTRLDPLNLKSSAELQLVLRRLSDSLVFEFESYRKSRSDANRIHVRDLLPALDALQVSIPNDPRKKRSFRSFGSSKAASGSRESASHRVARVAEVKGDPASLSSEEEDGQFAAAFAVIKSSQRRPSNSRYAFSKRDDFKSPLRRPPVPCKACGSHKHWDAECPMAGAHRTLKEVKEVHALDTERPPEQASLYDSMYESISRKYTASAYVAESQAAIAGPDVARAAGKASTRQAFKVEIEDLADEQGGGGRVNDPLGLHDALLRHLDDTAPLATEEPSVNLCPPKASIEIFPRRSFESGKSSIGVSVLSLKRRAGCPRNAEIDLRLDSGADVSLVSSEFYHSLPQRPRLKKGERLKLWQLLDKSAQIDGYITLNLFVRALDGTEIKLQCEAYVVPEMSVPILLGEDFQRTYELNVRRDLEKGTRVSFADLPYEVPARPVSKKTKIPALMQSMSAESSFVRAKASRRRAGLRARRRRADLKRKEEVLLKHDVTLAPGTVRLVSVDMDAELGQDWLIEKALIEAQPGLHLAVPNCLVSADDPRILLTNPTDKPLHLAAGTVLGLKRDPTVYFDSPKSLAQLERMLHAAARVAALAEATRNISGDAEERGAASEATAAAQAEEQPSEKEGAA